MNYKFKKLCRLFIAFAFVFAPNSILAHDCDPDPGVEKGLVAIDGVQAEGAFACSGGDVDDARVESLGVTASDFTSLRPEACGAGISPSVASAGAEKMDFVPAAMFMPPGGQVIDPWGCCDPNVPGDCCQPAPDSCCTREVGPGQTCEVCIFRE